MSDQNLFDPALIQLSNKQQALSEDYRFRPLKASDYSKGLHHIQHVINT